MKKKYRSAFLSRGIIIGFLLGLTAFQLSAQSITNYTFVASTPGFVPLTSPSATSWTGSTDDGVSALIPIGFDFWYMGTRYTDVSASTNGWLSLGVVPSDDLYTNSLSSGGAPRPVIAPLWDDLNITANTNVTYKTTGTAGSQVFTLQYLNIKWNYLASGSVISFQVKLYEGTGKIEFIYRPETTAASSPSASIGITATGTGSGNFLSVSNNGNNTSSSNEANITTRPASGRRYAFTPPVPTAPGSLTFSGVGGSAMTLHWTDLSANEAGFAIYRSTDGINYSFINQVAAGATSSLESGLTVNTTYYWKVYAVSVGALSTALSGSQATTLCQGPNISHIPATNLILNYKFNGNAIDASGNDNGTLQNAPAITADRFGNAASAYSFNGTSQYISTTNSYFDPNSYTMSIWFRTATTAGGLLMGFGNSQTGLSLSYDRNLYMNNAGQIYFGNNPTGGNATTINSASSYNDNNWHLATATLSGAGMILYIDGAQVATNAAVTSAQNFTGYWRVGFDNIQWWPSAPTSNYFNGTLDDVLVYHAALTPAEVATLYNDPDGAGSNAPVCAGTPLTLTATTVAGATYAWTGPNGFTSSAQNPSLTYSAAYAGVYQVQVTAAGCATPSIAYVKVASSTASGQWSGNVSSDWANADNWCEGVVPSSATDVVIAAGAGNMPAISSSVHCKNLTISTGATVTLNSAGTLNISGTLANSGTFTNNGTVSFEGTSGQQTFSGISAFYNITLNNTAGLLLPAAITVNHDLTLSAGTLDANNFNIAVKGNWTNNAATSAFTAGTATVTFNGTAAQAIGGSFVTTFNNLTVAGSANVVTLNVNTSITGNLTVAAGTLDLADFTADRTASGGILTVSNNATLKIGGTHTYPANYATNTLVVASTVEYSGTNQTVANQTYGNLKLSSAGGAAVKTFPGTALTVIGNFSSVLGSGTALSFTAAANITVNGNVSIGASTTFNSAGFSHSIGGSWSNNGTFNGDAGTVVFTGSGTTVEGSGLQNFNHLTVAASMVSFSSQGLSLTGNLATTGSGSFTQASGGTLVMSGTNTTISGAEISPNNLNITGSVTTSSSMILTGNLLVSGSFAATAGTITMNGAAKTISGSGTKTLHLLSVTGTITTDTDFSISSGLTVFGSLTASAGTVTFTGNSILSGTANLYHATLNGTSLQLSANSVLGIAAALNLTAGTLNVSSAPNTVNFNGATAQNINSITYSNLVLSNGGDKTAVGVLTVNNNITIGTGTTFIPGNFTHSVYNSWFNNGNFIAGGSTIQFLGSLNSTVNGATTFNALTVNNSTATVQLVLQSNVTAATVNMTMGTMMTGANTLTITGTRTGNGIILGNITRNHAFAALTPYAFEGPDNLVTFTAPVGINSVTVSITTVPAGDFPFGGSISRVYNISVPAGSYALATLRLHYEDAELNGNDESAIALWHYSGASWTASGKTTNSTTANYVELAAIPDITNRWTLSANSNVVQWNGSVSSDWNTAANWTVTEGSASSPPAATDIVNLGAVTFSNQPVISTAVTVRNINFGSAKAVALSLASGGSLNSTDIKGNWAANATHSIDIGSQSVTVSGDLALSDGTAGHVIHLNIGSGNLSIGGSLTESGGANITFSGAGNLSIGEDFNYSSGNFTAGAGTVTYNGPTNQALGIVNYNHLSINKAAANIVASSPLTVNGNLSLTAGEFDNNAVLTILGNVSIASGALLQNNSIIHVGGDWNNAGAYSFNNAETSVIFDGAGTQSISSSTFNNLEINKPPGSLAVLTGDVTLKGNLNGTSGTLDIKSFFFNRDVTGGTATISDAGTLIIGANNAPNKFANYVLGANSTVIFNGLSTQHLLLPGLVYGNITFNNTGTKILHSPTTIKGTLTIGSGATFDGGSNTITLGGDWINGGTFTPSASTVTLTGAGKNISGNTTFNKVTVTGSYTLLGDMTFNGLLNITSTGSFSAGTTVHTTMNGDLINSGILYTLGTTTFTGNVVQTLSLINAVNTVALRVNFNGSVSPVLNSTSVPQFGYLTINNTGGVHPSVGWTILYALTIGSGATFNGGSSTHNILGTVVNNGTVSSSGVLNFIPSSPVSLNLGSNFSSTGTVNFGGAGAMTLTGTPASFHNVLISNTNVAGVSPAYDWTIVNNFTVNSGSVLHAGNHTWLIGGNISSSGTMNSGTSTFILNGSGTQSILTASAFNNLTVDKATGLATLSADATVNGVLNFIAGKIQTGSNRLIQPSSGTVTGAAQNTGWVDGRLQKNIITGATVKTFEVGDALNYTPVSVAFSNVVTAGDLTAFTTAGDHPDIGSSTINTAQTVNRFWTLSNNGIGFTQYNATFSYVSADVDAGANTNAFILGKYNGSLWTYPTTGTLTATSLQATGLTTFEDFQVGTMRIFSKTWDGGAGTQNWGDAANWNTDGVPTAADDVNLTGADTIQINVAATTKNLLLDNGGLVLTTNAGNSLSVSGNLTLTNGTFNTAAAFPAVSGTVNVTGGTVGFTGNSPQTIPAYNYNNLTSGGTGSRTFTNSGTIGIAGIFTAGTNAYTTTGSTIDLNGDRAQTIPALNYHNLSLSNTGVKTFDAGTTGIAGVLSVTGTATAKATTNFATVRYNGSANQTITPITYYNLEASNPSGIVTLQDVTVVMAFGVTLGTVHIGNDNNARTIHIEGDMNIANGATLGVSPSSDALHAISISGDLINNGTLDLSTDGNSLATVSFTKDGNQSVSGPGISDFHHITLNQGISNANTLQVSAPGFTAPNGFLTLNNGTFKLDNATLSIIPFNTDISTGQYLIPETAGLWVNAGTVNSPAMNWTVAGLVKITGGTLNMGNVSGNVVIPKDQAQFLITAGTLNLASALSNPGAVWHFEMQNGTVNVNTLGSTADGIAPFNMDAAASVFNVTGGSIVIQNSGGSTGQNLGYKNYGTAGTGFTGGTLQMGNIATTGSQTMDINTTGPLFNLQLNSSGVTVPLLNNDLTVKNDVAINAGTLNIHNRLLKIGGNISNSGSFIVNEGTVEMNGSAVQTIPAGAFTGNLAKNLTVNNPAGVILGGPLALTDILLVTTGQFNSGGNLTLVSTAAKTALIDGSGLGTVAGNVTMQRYLIAGFGYKYFSPPFQNATVNSFAATVDLNASFPNFYNYIENKASSGFTSYTSPSALLYPLQGYAADFGSSTASKTVNMTGIVNNGPQSVTLYNNNQLYTKGFNLVGNPYPSPVNWDAALGWNRTNIDNAVYFFNSGSSNQYTGAYSTYINGVSSDGVTGPVIASMQGFFVHVSDGPYPVTGTFAINNAARVNDLSPVFHKSALSFVPVAKSKPRVLLRLSANFADHAQSSDPLVVYSNDQATTAFDKQLEAVKLMNVNEELPNLYVLGTGDSKMVINAVAAIDTATIIPLGIQIEKDGKVSFNLRNLENWPFNLNLYLTDAVTGINHDLQRNAVYTVNLKKGKTENRFSLRCTAGDPGSSSNGDIYTIYGSAGQMYLKIKLVNEQRGYLMISNVIGQVISRQKIEGNGDYPLERLKPDVIYLVSFVTPKGTHTKKILINGR